MMRELPHKPQQPLQREPQLLDLPQLLHLPNLGQWLNFTIWMWHRLQRRILIVLQFSFTNEIWRIRQVIFIQTNCSHMFPNGITPILTCGWRMKKCNFQSRLTKLKLYTRGLKSFGHQKVESFQICLEWLLLNVELKLSSLFLSEIISYSRNHNLSHMYHGKIHKALLSGIKEGSQPKKK